MCTWSAGPPAGSLSAATIWGGASFPAGPGRPEGRFRNSCLGGWSGGAGAGRPARGPWCGAHGADHRPPPPHRPPLPHPVSYWAVFVADVVIEQEPTNPEDGEQVTAVLVLPADEAAAYLEEQPDGIMGPIVRLAQAMELV